jgi:Na+-translocating ferredoxin:NAD+ oxidoreductase RnfA subunit
MAWTLKFKVQSSKFKVKKTEDKVFLFISIYHNLITKNCLPVIKKTAPMFS